MKKVISCVAVFLLASVVCMGSASALTFTDTSEPSGGHAQINNDNNSPGDWFNLDLPIMANAGFVYDSNKVTKFTIDMYGYDDEPGGTIDIWRRATGNNATAALMVPFDVDNSDHKFILRLNLMNGNLYRSYSGHDAAYNTADANFVDTGMDITNGSLASFNGLASFDIGYACHFRLDQTVLTIEQTAVPEPTTMLLLGFGLIGLAGIRRKLGK
jgi:hypothetical protein